MESADLVVIGSGQGGSPLAARLAQEGRGVVLFERAQLGGSCVNYGCTPSKVFLAGAHAAGNARRADKLGVHARPEVNFGAVMARVRDFSRQSRENTEKHLVETGVRIVRAHGSFTGERSVEGGGVEVKAGRVVINTGVGPRIPDIAGLISTPYLNYLNFWQLTELPGSVMVLGGGYIGLELGQGLARLGSKVTLLESGPRVMAREEDEVGDTLRTALEEDGLIVRTNVKVERVRHSRHGHAGQFTVTLEGGEEVIAQSLLVVVGVTPHTEKLGAEAAGVELDEQGFVRVNDRFETTAPGVYAIGDVKGGPGFTHVSWEDHRRLLGVWRGEDRKVGDRVLGYAAFTEPQLGRVGHDEKSAREAGLAVRVAHMPMSKVAHAAQQGEELGFLKLVVDANDDRILGATIVGPQAAELVHVVLAHMEAGSTWRVLERSQHIHPALAEGLPTLARQLLGE